MRPTCLLLLLLAACGGGSSSTTSASATDGATGSTGADTPTTTRPTSDTGETPTGGAEAGMTGTTSTTGSDSSSSDTGSDTGSTTAPVLTGTSVDPSTSTGADATTSTGPDDTTSTTSESSGDTSTGDEPCACPDLEVPLDDGIFVLSDTGEMWKYFPKDNTFALLGELGCDLQPPTFSMAVDRLGYAWVEYPSGALRKVAVGDVSDCTDPGYAIGQQGIQNFGMAFVSNSASDKCDRIYGSEYNGFPMNDFFSIDPDGLLLAKIGATPSGISEVTGTGDGRAFLFTDSSPVTLVEVDKDVGLVLSSTALPAIDIGSGLAFAFFAGDFYFFTDSEFDFTSEVTHMDYDDSDNNGAQDLTQIFSDAPLRILGAGVSTCAPTLPQ